MYSKNFRDEIAAKGGSPPLSCEFEKLNNLDLVLTAPDRLNFQIPRFYVRFWLSHYLVYFTCALA